MITEADYTPTFRRDTQGWMAMLRGHNGPEQQRMATEELARQFSVAALRCIRNRRDSTRQLALWSDQEVVDYARAVVDATIADLMIDDFRAFESFDEQRLFAVQAAQLIIDHIAADLEQR